VARAASAVPAAPTATSKPATAGLIGRTLADIERWAIEETIAREGGSVPRAARVLDVAPSTIYRKMEGWGETMKSSAE
jgi:two-component system, repressor protein LuxO